MLSQEHDNGSFKPVAYASRSLHGAEFNYPVTELEALGVIWATQKLPLWTPMCRADRPSTTTKFAEHPTPVWKRWGLVLQELDLEIRYRPGRQNFAANAIERSTPTKRASARR